MKWCNLLVCWCSEAEELTSDGPVYCDYDCSGCEECEEVEPPEEARPWQYMRF